MLITKDSCDPSDLELFIKKCRRLGYRDHKDIKQLEIEKNKSIRQLDNLKKELPNKIRNVIGHIEFARPLDK